MSEWVQLALLMAIVVILSIMGFEGISAKVQINMAKWLMLALENAIAKKVRDNCG